MTKRTSNGKDSERTMALLWGVRKVPGRGPKPSLNVERLARAAVEVADEGGLSALSMRRVAEKLGISTMSLYTYVPGKAELTDVMLDAVFAEVSEPDEDAGGWREKLDSVARENRALFRRHPWISQAMSMNRPTLGPNAIARYDRELRAVEGIGLTDLEMDAVLTLVLGHVQGTARWTEEAAATEEQTGRTDEEWWTANAPLLEKVLDPERFPVAARVGLSAGTAHQAAYSPEHAFEFGLKCILDGIEALIRSRPSEPEI